MFHVNSPQVGTISEGKEAFEEELLRKVGNMNIVVFGDFNAFIGRNRNGYVVVLGREGWG